MFTRRRWAGWLTGCFLQGVLRLLAAHAGPPAEAASDAHLSVGMTGQIDQLVLPGSELEVRPLEDRRAPFVLRITDVYPHGSAFRYDLVYYGLEPGRYDLRNYLRRKDGSALGELPPVLVQVEPILPPGQVEPSPLELAPSPRLGGYRWLLALGGSLWCAGLVAIVVLGRRRVSEAVSNAGKPATLADRLRPLVDAAVAGTLDQGQQAELERLLIGYWRKRLGLEQQSPSGAMAALRAHPQAGALIRTLEDWLHRPAADRAQNRRRGRPAASLPGLAPRRIGSGWTGRSGPRTGGVTWRTPLSFAYPWLCWPCSRCRSCFWAGSGSGRAAEWPCRLTTAATDHGTGLGDRAQAGRLTACSGPGPGDRAPGRAAAAERTHGPGACSPISNSASTSRAA